MAGDPFKMLDYCESLCFSCLGCLIIVSPLASHMLGYNKCSKCFPWTTRKWVNRL